MKNEYINASDIGKTAYCPHSHYLSTKRAAGKDTKKRLKQGTEKHEWLDKQATGKVGAFKLTYGKFVLIVVVAVIAYQIFTR